MGAIPDGGLVRSSVARTSSRATLLIVDGSRHFEYSTGLGHSHKWPHKLPGRGTRYSATRETAYYYRREVARNTVLLLAYNLPIFIIITLLQYRPTF